MKFFRKSAFSTTTCLATAALAMMGTASAAQAQDSAAADSAEACVDANNNGVCDKDEKGDIVVVGTGSRLTRPTLSSPVPLTSVTPGELSDGGDVSLGDALNDLPSLRSTYSAGNSTRFIGTAGLNLLDLRGLGPSRTLVLVNGKRHVAALPGDYLIDVNVIPVDLLERVDVVTGGNSAVYGSDAVAGVVNFVLKRNYDGIALRAQGGTTKNGDRGNYFISGVFGRNFADGRGNIAVSAEYAKAEPLYFRDRDDLSGAFSGRCQINTIEPTGGEPNGTDGIWDTAFVCGVRNAAISDAGTIGAIDPASNPQRRYLRFDDAGQLVLDTPILSYAPIGGGNQIGGFGSTLRNTGMMAAGLDRYSINALTHFDFSDGLRWFAEGKYVRVTSNQEGQPTFMASATFNPTWRCDNGFLSAQNLNVMRSYGLCPATAAGTTIPGSATDRGITGQTFPLNRFNVDMGGRGETHVRETYRIVTGFEGTFNDDWKYEIAVNYGELRTSMNAINVARIRDDAGTAPDGLALAVDAVIAPAGFAGTNFVLNDAGEKVICRVNAVTNTRPDCVPINLFGQNRYSADAYAFSNGTAQRKEKATQFVVSANVAGDLSQLFELPGGPIGFVLGAEYREETAFSHWDQASQNGAFFFNRFQNFDPPKFTVKEAYGEIDLPLVKDLPFIKELTVRGAGRVSDYNTATGTVWAWNVDGIYAPVDDVRFRVAYATSVRAPTQSNLFFPQTQSFAFIADPCDSVNISSNPNRAANCAAAGVPVTYNAAMTAPCSATPYTGTPGVTPWRNCTALTSSTGFVQGGNPTLVAERGKSLTIGMVL
ncbi:MAG: TonB-dependent receptor domain-containing protein, partial [Novosphingobium sp.]